METRNQSSSPDNAHPNGGQPGDWIARPYSPVLITAGLFILIIGIAVFLGYRHYEVTRYNALGADRMTANLLADLLMEHNKATIGILQSYAHRPLFVDAVKRQDRAGASRHLIDLKKNTEIDLTLLADPRGIAWANYPVFPEVIAKNLSDRDWYQGVRSQWRPYISNVFQLIVGDKPLAVAMAVPVFDEKGKVIGILATSQRLSFLVDAIQRVPLDPYMSVSVIDREGHILYNNESLYQETMTAHRFFPLIKAALKEKNRQIEIDEPQQGQGKIYLTAFPVGDSGWSVTIERSLKDIFKSDYRRFIELMATSFLLFLLIVFLLAYIRNVFLFRKAKELLQAEKKLRQSEESERETRDYLEKLIGYANAPIIVWDPQFRITRFNHAFEDLTGLQAGEVLGKEIDLLFPEGRREVSLGLIRQTTGGKRWEAIEIPILHRDGSVRTVLWNSATIYSPDGRTSVATIAQGQDITERKQAEEILELRFKLMQYAASHNLEEVLQAALDEIGTLTGSPIGFYHFVEADEKTLSLQAWSTRTAREFCKAEGKGLHYGIDKAGVWVDSIRERKAVIHNDYPSLPHRKGMPPGHAAIQRELTVPIFRNQKIVAILGLGNKPTDYTEDDIRIVSFLADVTWEMAQKKRAEEALEEERRRLQQALDEVRTLRGIVPICASCKNIRDDKGFWNQVEKYVSDHTEAEFSHSICPDCAKKLYPELYKDINHNEKP
jgi:PAS domain S-box-containing protein